MTLDNEGQFNLCAGSTFAEAVLGMVSDEEEFTELRDWMESLGIPIEWESPDDVTYPEEESPPDQMCKELYYRSRGKSD